MIFTRLPHLNKRATKFVDVMNAFLDIFLAHIYKSNMFSYNLRNKKKEELGGCHGIRRK